MTNTKQIKEIKKFVSSTKNTTWELRLTLDDYNGLWGWEVFKNGMYRNHTIGVVSLGEVKMIDESLSIKVGHTPHIFH